MLTAVATKSLKIVIFNHLMIVDANCDDSVTIPRCPNLVVDLKVSVALKKLSRAYARILGTPPIPYPGSTPGMYTIGTSTTVYVYKRVYLHQQDSTHLKWCMRH